MTIAIVTAFFDIDRENWGSRPGIPHWLPRSVNNYFECFERMCRLNNDLVVFTEEKFGAQILSLHQKYGLDHKTRVFSRNILADHRGELDSIARVMSRPGFLDGVTTPYCPEYWEPRYVLVNYLKSSFVCDAIEGGGLKDALVAWLDFAYCRDDSCLPRGLTWDYPFSDKIHLFNIALLVPQNLVHIIKTNTVYFQGCPIIASRDRWRRLRELMRQSFDTLIRHDLIDDDQTMLLMSYLSAPDLFETHAVDTASHGWFGIVRDYNVCHD